MTPCDLEKIKERLKTASNGWWFPIHGLLHEDFPALIAEVEALRSRDNGSAEALRLLEVDNQALRAKLDKVKTKLTDPKLGHYAATEALAELEKP